jgi:phosphoribosylaminoimidazole (AIR) synthetase
MPVNTMNVPAVNCNIVLPVDGDDITVGFSALSEIGVNSTSGDELFVGNDAVITKAKTDVKVKKCLDVSSDCAKCHMADAITKGKVVKEPKEEKVKRW